MFKRSLTSAMLAGIAVTGLSLIATTAFAFDGCVNSPENPTWILAGIGVAAAAAPWLRSIAKHRRK